MTDAIWTLDARDSVMLDVMKSALDLSDEVVRNEILSARQVTVDALSAKGVSYEALRNALVPQRDRVEVALLFDTAQIESHWYGFPVAEQLIPLLPSKLLCAIRTGDLLTENQDFGFDLLQKHVIAHRVTELAHTSQLYCVYVNNLSRRMAETITSELQRYQPFVGYVDVSTGSRMKDWLSVTLVMGYLKARGVVLNGHEDDVPDSEDRNMLGWPWENHGYSCRSIRGTYFDLLLAYKIERRVVPGLESDTAFALTAISGRPLPLKELAVTVEKAKGEYIRAHHEASLARAGLDRISDADLASLIRAKISESYIYNLRYVDHSDTSLFNLMLEFRDPASQAVTRLVAALEYQPVAPMLRLVTLF